MRIQFLGLRLDISWPSLRQSLAPRDRPKEQDSPKEPASETFWHIFSTGATIAAQCSCGRTHFCDSPFYENHAEFNKYLKLRAENPDKYILSPDDSVAICDIEGIVWGCVCGRDAKYERFLEEYEPQIIAYYWERLLERREDVADREQRMQKIVEFTKRTK